MELPTWPVAVKPFPAAARAASSFLQTSEYRDWLAITQASISLLLLDACEQ